MVRTLTLTLALLLLAAARVAAADETAKSASAAAESASATSAVATVQPGKATKPASKKPAAGTKAGDDNADSAAATSQAEQPGADVKMSGMSILGNEDAPKSLVLVPWKSSQLADMPTVARLLDSATQPVDKDVFMRELAYYEFKSSSK
jgi:hypothetical protein